MSCGDIFLGLIAVLFPPVAVWIKSGLCSADSFINILLCMLGYLPGLIHAWYIIAKYPEYDYEAIPDSEAAGPGRGGQRVTYYYVSHENQGRSQGNASYGTQGQRQAQAQGQGRTKPQGRAPAAPQNSRPAVAGPSSGAASNDNAAPPPSYADAVGGDHKVQSRE